MPAPRRPKTPLRITRYYNEDPAAIAAAAVHAIRIIWPGYLQEPNTAACPESAPEPTTARQETTP